MIFKDNSQVLRIGLAALCIFAFQTAVTVFCFHAVLYLLFIDFCPQQCAQPVETPPQEAKSPVNPTEADEKKVEEPEVKERPDEPMEVESKGISEEVV